MAGRHEEAGYGYRSAGWVDSLRGEEEGILVDHVYNLEPIKCAAGHDNGPDPGAVRLLTFTYDEDGEHVAIAVLAPNQALRLAYLLHRVVGWIDDVDGDTPDLEREAARWERKTDA